MTGAAVVASGGIGGMPVSTVGGAVTTLTSASSAPRSTVILPVVSDTTTARGAGSESTPASSVSTLPTVSMVTGETGISPVDPVTAPVVPATSGPVVPTSMPGVFPTPANLLPQIPPYHGGEQMDGETFQDWLEHFEAVSQLARWDDHYKLVYLTTALRGTAKSFYRSCSPTQWSSYRSLVAELKKSFTPVQLTAVQTQLFHDRRQGPQETVDDFAQDLRRQYSRAYARFTRGTPEAERVGQTVLASQFVAGLRPSLQAKVVGMESGMDQLVLRVRFEEAKSKELASVKAATQAKSTTRTNPSDAGGNPMTGPPKGGDASKSSNSQGQTPPRHDGKPRRCFNCGLEGHMARACPYPKTSKRETEAKGRKEGTVTTIEEEGTGPEDQLADLRRQLREAELTIAVQRSSVLYQLREVRRGLSSGPLCLWTWW